MPAKEPSLKSSTRLLFDAAKQGKLETPGYLRFLTTNNNTTVGASTKYGAKSKQSQAALKGVRRSLYGEEGGAPGRKFSMLDPYVQSPGLERSQSTLFSQPAAGLKDVKRSQYTRSTSMSKGKQMGLTRMKGDNLPQILGYAEGYHTFNQSTVTPAILNKNYSQYFNVVKPMVKINLEKLQENAIRREQSDQKLNLSHLDMPSQSCAAETWEGEQFKAEGGCVDSQRTASVGCGILGGQNNSALTGQTSGERMASLPNVLSDGAELFALGAPGVFMDSSQQKRLYQLARKKIRAHFKEKMPVHSSQGSNENLNRHTQYGARSTSMASLNIRGSLDPASQLSQLQNTRSSLVPLNPLETTKRTFNTFKNQYFSTTTPYEALMTDKNEEHQSVQALQKPTKVPGNAYQDPRDKKSKYAAMHENYQLATNPRFYDAHMEEVRRQRAEPVAAKTRGDTQKEVPIEGYVNQADYPDLEFQQNVSKKEFEDDGREFLFYLDNMSKSRYLGKLDQYREGRKKKGQHAQSVDEERVNWSIDVFPAMDNVDSIVKEGDRMIYEIKERKFKDYLRQTSGEARRDEAQSKKSAGKPKQGAAGRYANDKDHDAKPAVEEEKKSKNQAQRGDRAFQQYQRQQQEIKIQKQREKMANIAILDKFDAALQAIRLNYMTVPYHSHIKLTENGKIDIKQILRRFNHNKKMHVDPHDFIYKATKDAVMKRQLKLHQKSEHISGLLHIFSNDEIMAHALYIDGMSLIGQEDAIKQIKEEKHRNKIRLYLKLLKELKNGIQHEKTGRESNDEGRLTVYSCNDIYEYIAKLRERKSEIITRLSSKVDHFSKFKASLFHSAQEINHDDPSYIYLKEVENNQNIIYPIFQEIIDRQLTLYNQSLREGHAKGIKSACKIKPDFLRRVILHRNGLNDERASTILEALTYQSDIKSICVAHNQIGKLCIPYFQKLLTKTVPNHLSELRLAQCKIVTPETLKQLLKILTNKQTFLSSLGLVKVPLMGNMEAFNYLCEYIALSRTLRKLDLSWNEFTQPFAQKTNNQLLKSICKNEYLTDINLSWNALISNVGVVPDEPLKQKKPEKKNKKKVHVPLSPYQTIQQTMMYFQKILKHKKRLQHLNLAQIGLNYEQILTLCSWIIQGSEESEKEFKSFQSLQAIHFCNNVNVTQDFINLLRKVLQKGHDLQEILEKSKTIQSTFTSLQLDMDDNVNQKQMKIEDKNIKDSIFGRYIQKAKDIEQDQMNLMAKTLIDTNNNNQNKLIVSRSLGHELDIPRPEEREWQLLTKQNDCCLICNLNRYTVLLWKHDTNKQARQEIKQITCSNAKQQEQLQKVQIQGSFTGNQPHQMMPLIEFLDQICPKIPDILQRMNDEGSLDRHQLSFTQLRKDQKAKYSSIENDLINANVANWPKVFADYIGDLCSQPFIINGDMVENIQSDQLKDVYVYFGYLPPGRLSYEVQYRPNIDDRNGELDYRWTPKSKDHVRTESNEASMESVPTKEDPLSEEGEEAAEYKSYQDVCHKFTEIQYVDIRREAIRGHEASVDQIQQKQSDEKTQFEKHRSNFYELKNPDDAKLTNQCWVNDRNKANIASLIPEIDDKITIAKIEEVLENNYKHIRYLYLLLQSQIKDEKQYPWVSKDQIKDMILKFDLQQLGMSEQDVDQIIQQLTNPKQGGFFMRYNLLQIFVLISKLASEQENVLKPQQEEGRQQLTTSLKQSESSPTARFAKIFAARLDSLISEELVPCLQQYEIFPQYWREEALFTAEIDRIFSANKMELSAIFRKYMKVKRSATYQGVMDIFFLALKPSCPTEAEPPAKPEIPSGKPGNAPATVAESDEDEDEEEGGYEQVALPEQFEQPPKDPAGQIFKYGTTKAQAMQCYALSRQIVIQEKYSNLDEQERIKMHRMSTTSTTDSDYNTMTFVELLEMLGRLAQLRFAGSEQEHLGIGEKILVMIDGIFKRNDPEGLLGYYARDPANPLSERQEKHRTKHLRRLEERKQEELKAADKAAREAKKAAKAAKKKAK